MNTDKHLQFILDKILEINVALFHCQSTSVLKFPSTIVNTYSIDEAGNILLFLPRPKQYLSEFDREFLVSLNYFKKGINHYMNIDGFARVINDPEELYSYDLTYEQLEKALHTEMLVKVKILRVHYFEPVLARRNVFSKVKSFIYSLLAWVEPEAKSFDFSRKSQQIHNYGF